MLQAIAGTIILIKSLQLFLIASQALTIFRLIDEIARLKKQQK